jgi:hypothetical protein
MPRPRISKLPGADTEILEDVGNRALKPLGSPKFTPAKGASFAPLGFRSEKVNACIFMRYVRVTVSSASSSPIEIVFNSGAIS